VVELEGAPRGPPVGVGFCQLLPPPFGLLVDDAVSFECLANNAFTAIDFETTGLLHKATPAERGILARRAAAARN
jgi:hypothetical protein